MSEPAPSGPPSWRSPAAAGPGALGIGLALAALLLAFFPAGAGHGWGAPFLYSLPLLLVYPWALVCARTGGRQGIGIDAALIVFAIAANVGLVASAIDYRADRLVNPREVFPGVDRSVFPMFLLWLALWLYWQFVAARSLWRRVRDTRVRDVAATSE